jgi:hypothetical protein
MSHLIGGAVMGLVAIAAGGAFIAGALRRSRGQAYDLTTYRAAGGPVYMFFQISCGGVLLLAGLGVLAQVALDGPPG